MIPIECPFPPGLVVIISGDQARYNEFSESLLRLAVPYGSHWEWARGTSIESNRNMAVSKVRAEDKWLFLLDDDHAFAPDLLMRLLERMGMDSQIHILQALCPTRKPPYRPWAYREDPVNGDSSFDIHYVGASWDEVPTTGISEWDAVGTGGMLVRSTVIRKLAYPWFEVGHTSRDAYGEDLYFCYKAKRAGFRIWIDSDNRTAHMTNAVGLEPAIDIDGRWRIDAIMGNGLTLAVPQEAWEHVELPTYTLPVPDASD